MSLRKPRWRVRVPLPGGDTLLDETLAEETWEVTESGVLVFSTDGDVRRAYAPGHWASVGPL